MPFPRPLLAAAAVFALVGCGLIDDGAPVRVAAIGTLNRNLDRAPSPLSLPNRLLIDATAGGLVGYSADGQVEAGLAERWTVIDGGRSYIFRIRDARWASGRPVRTREVARVLQRLIASPRLRSPLRGEFRSIRDIRAMTASVIEIRLTRPQPDLLDLLAQPDMGIVRNGEGWGPLRPRWTGGSVTLVPAVLPGSTAEASGDEPAPVAILWGTNAASAIAQFDAGVVAAVFGGRYQDWPLIAAAGLSDDMVRMDPVDGLFGLAVVEKVGLLATVEGRAAVDMAIDRAALDDALDMTAWQPRVSLRGGGGAAVRIAPALPEWIDLTPPERRARARGIVAAWSASDNGGDPPVLRIALPDGVGSRRLFARLRTDLVAVGIRARRVTLSEDADLRLIDDIAPGSDPAWYVRRLGCEREVGCDPALTEQLAAIDDAPAGAPRAAAIQAAEATIAAHGGFIALGAPLRWSLARPGLAGVRANPRGRHSLIRLRDAPD